MWYDSAAPQNDKMQQMRSGHLDGGLAADLGVGLTLTLDAAR